MLGGGSFAAASLTLGTTGLFSGFGTITSAVANAGTVQASGGVLTVSGAITGALAGNHFVAQTDHAGGTELVLTAAAAASAFDPAFATPAAVLFAHH
jgi:hypothetical protein